MLPKTIIHLLSGGLDSVTLLYDLKSQGHNVHCVLFDYKQQHVQELSRARSHCRKQDVQYTVIELPQLGGLTDASWIVPNRNCIMLSLAVNLAVKARADTVTIGCNKEDEAAFPDCRMAFIQTFNNMLTTAEIPVEVCAPYIDWPKWKIAALSKRLKISTDEIWTCYQPKDGEPCGECPACKKLMAAFQTESEQREMRPC